MNTDRNQRLKIGDGRISEYLAFFLSLLSLGAVICFHFPEHLTTPEFRAFYPIEGLRWVLLLGLVLSYIFAFLSFLLGAASKLSLIAIVLTTFAILIGGSSVEVTEFEQSVLSMSLDWLIIDIVILSLIFVPLELFFPKNKDQTKFHREWKTDLVYFAISHGWGLESLQATVSNLPFLLQVLLAMLVADLCQYGIHRSFHASSFLWRFHSIHHSIKTIDWMAGSRLHIVDVIVTRAVSYIPLYVLGFSMAAFYTYVVIVALQAVAAHSNVRFKFSVLKYILVTPQFHNWHHSDDPKRYNKNFAIHFPLIDKVFGTYYLPGSKWPESTGLGNAEMPK